VERPGPIVVVLDAGDLARMKERFGDFDLIAAEGKKRAIMRRERSRAVSQSPSTEQAAPAHPYRVFATRAGLGVAVVAVLLWRYDARPIFRILSRERPTYFAAVVLLYVAGQAMCAYRWQRLAALLKVNGRYGEFLA